MNSQNPSNWIETTEQKPQQEAAAAEGQLGPPSLFLAFLNHPVTGSITCTLLLRGNLVPRWSSFITPLIIPPTHPHTLSTAHMDLPPAPT